MFGKLFRKSPKKETGNPSYEPNISFGRYSDNNKPVAKINRWTDADNLYKEKKYPESLDAFFEYLRDDRIQNVVYERNGSEGRFQFYQGSKIVRGEFNKELFKAEVTLARMPQPSVPVMRRLLETNFSLYYSRYALDNERLCMNFDSAIETASPSKLYFGLKELATKADKQDDLLTLDFTSLVATDREHIVDIPETEKEIKYEYLQKWITQTLEATAGLDAEKFSGGIAYMLLSLIYRIDYLIAPEGQLLFELEKTAGIYFGKEERTVADKNRDMAQALKKIQGLPKDTIFECLFRSKHTFSIVAPQPYKTVAESIGGVLQNVAWYRDNNFTFIANEILEYGIMHCQYSYSLPRAVTDLAHLFMMVNHPDYFNALGFTVYYDPEKNRFYEKEIIERIDNSIWAWRDKYPELKFNTSTLRFENLLQFNYTFCTEMVSLQIEQK